MEVQDILNKILNFDLTILGNILAITGGFLGIYSFIDNYLLKFKPKFFISNIVNFKIEITEKYLKYPVYSRKNYSVKSIICTLEVGNHRNKYGVINDIAIKIFDRNNLNPSPRFFYAKKDLEFPIQSSNEDEFKAIKKSSFSPINILPKSSKKVHIEFSSIYDYVEMIPKSTHNYIEIYYQLGKKWYYDSGYFLYEEREQEDNNLLVTFKTLDRDVERDKLPQQSRKIYSIVFFGESTRKIKRRLEWYLYVMKSILPKKIAEFFLIIPIVFIQILSLLYDKTIRKRLFSIIKNNENSYNKNRQNQITGYKNYTENKFKTIQNLFKIEIEKINTQYTDDKKIILEIKENQISIFKGTRNVKIYISGDKNIQVSDSNNYEKVSINMTMNYEIKLFGIKCWKLNGKIVTVEGFVLRVIDAILLHSRY